MIFVFGIREFTPYVLVFNGYKNQQGVVIYNKKKLLHGTQRNFIGNIK